jgi:signal transduction histidine kinase
MSPIPGELEEGDEGFGFARLLRECTLCGIIVVDSQKRITSLTDEAAQILGLTSPVPTPSPHDILPKPLLKVIEEGARHFQGITRQINIPLHDRPSLGVSVKVMRVEPAHDHSPLLVVLNAFSSTTRVEECVRQLDRLASTGTLSAGLAHEIRNALVAGKTFIDLLLEKNRDAELADIVRREIAKIDAIVSQMLKFANPGRAARALVHLHDLLEHSVRLVQPQFTGKDVTLRRSFAADCDLIQGDDYQLEQAFVNLFLNALEATAPSGSITIATQLIAGHSRKPKLRSAHRQLRVIVQDNGTGIPPETMQHIFEPFFTTKPNGTGLGLAITQRIIQEHRGTITVESEPNKGSTFSITFAQAE